MGFRQRFGSGGDEDDWGGGDESQLKPNLESIIKGQKVKKIGGSFLYHGPAQRLKT